MKLVFVCSPFSAYKRYGDKEIVTVERNVVYARKLCAAALGQGVAPFAPHLMYPQFLDDLAARERKLGIECGLAWLGVCDELWIAPGYRSDGMWVEIWEAQRLGMPIKERLPFWKDVPHA